MPGNDEDRMSKESEFPDEKLMAFADGELEGSDREAVERAIDTDPEIAARVALFMETRDRVRGAFGRTLSERPPDRLFDAVMGARTISGAAMGKLEARVAAPFEKAANENRSASSWRPLALAASLAAVAAGLAGYLTGGARNEPGSALAVLASAPAAVSELLSSPVEGQPSALPGRAATLTIASTYRLRDGRVCRAFEVRHPSSRTGAEAVGCRNGSGWSLEAALPRTLVDGVFRPASAGATIDAFLDASGAGQALPKPEVEALGRGGWR
jgi:anti-sigma factor RsiW